ncbi:MAG TPA: amidohydrolase family protein [Patescibacteria group bacterium]|nr:amidohydrolase family protein [Patescibacteria group bacterium]
MKSFKSSHLGPRLRLVAAVPNFAAGLALLLSFIQLTLLGQDSFVLSGATVHTISGQTFSPGEVLVRNGKIAGVGEKVSAGDAKPIDVKGMHLYPSLIGLDTVLGLVEIEAVRATEDLTEVGEYRPDVQSWVAVNPDSELIPVTRANGIGYFEPAPQGGIVAGQSGLVAVEGWTSEQMAVRKPIALHVAWPSFELDTTPKDRLPSRAKFKSLDEQAKDRRAAVKAIDEFFEEAKAYLKAKDAAADGKSTAPDRAPAWEAMIPYLRGELPIVIHADEVRQIKSALTWAGTNKYKVILAGGRDAAMVADLLAAKKIPLIYEHTFTQPVRATESYDVHFAAPAALHKAGVQVIFSIGPRTFETPMARNLPYAAAQAVAFGLAEEEALKGLTLYPAQLAGVADRLGSIEPGKDASFFVADGDILDLRANVKRMWLAGHEVSLESKHTRLYEKYKNRPKL